MLQKDFPFCFFTVSVALWTFDMIFICTARDLNSDRDG